MATDTPAAPEANAPQPQLPPQPLLAEALGELVRAMQAIGLPTSLTDLRDVLWLAHRIGIFVEAEVAAPNAIAPAPRLPPAVPLAGESSGVRSTPVPGRDGPAAGAEADALYAAVAGGGSGAGGNQARRVQLRGAPALPQALAIGRALRPLSRRRPGALLELDERATAEFIAESRVRAPVWRRSRERWFDIVLALEDVPSMAAWQPVVTAFERLLLLQGGFRSVSRLVLRLGEERLLASTPGGRPVGARALVDRHGRRIVLALSDCTSAAWRGGAVGAWLQGLAEHAPVALVQLLPQTLWPNTATGFAELRAAAPRFGAPSARLRVQRPSWAHGEPGLVLPVLPLEPAAVAAWARMVVAAGNAWTAAALLPLPDDDLDLDLAAAGATGDATSGGTLAAADRAAAFRASATSDAQRLAAYFSVVRPLTPPVMRVIQQALAPASAAAALAQVFLGGLLLPVGSAAVAVDDREYDFHAGLRELLQAGLTRSEFLQVNLALHQHLQQESGTPFDFFALLEDRGGSTQLPAAALPFVQTARAAARRFGGAPATPAVPGAAPAAVPISDAGPEPVSKLQSGVEQAADTPAEAIEEQTAGSVFEVARLTITLNTSGSTLSFVHRSQRGELTLRQAVPGAAAELLMDALLHERGGDFDGLAAMLVPRGLQDSTAVATGPPWLELALDEGTAAYPWELMLKSVSSSKPPLALQRGLTRRQPLSSMPPRSLRPGLRALVIGDPLTDSDSGLHSLPAARREAQRIAALLAPVLGAEQVQLLVGAGSADIFAALDRTERLDGQLRVLHIAAHGRLDFPQSRRLPTPADLAQRAAFMLDGGVTLGLAELITPTWNRSDLVFLGSHRMAALAPHLLRHGAEVVVAPVGVIDDESAAAFSIAFFQALADGQPLVQATQHARQECRRLHPSQDTWGKFQCWGDPLWLLRPGVERAAAAEAAAAAGAEPRSLPRLAECRHLAYISSAQGDDEAHHGWVGDFGNELQRSIAASMRGVKLPPIYTVRQSPAVFSHDEMRQRIASSFTLIAVVGEHYAQSEWCLRELELAIETFGPAFARERLYVVALSKSALYQLQANPTWRRLLGEGQVWMPFFNAQTPDRPIAVYLANGLFSPAFREPFERLRNDLGRKLRADLAAARETTALSPPEPEPKAESATVPAPPGSAAAEPPKVLVACSAALDKDGQALARVLRQNTFSPRAWQRDVQVLAGLPRRPQTKGAARPPWQRDVDACDVLVMLRAPQREGITGKVFDRAVERFKASGRPLILVYVKAPTASGASLLSGAGGEQLRRQLDALDIGYVAYEQVHELAGQVVEQVDRLVIRGSRSAA